MSIKYLGMAIGITIIAGFAMGFTPSPQSNGMSILFPQGKKLLVNTSVASVTGQFDSGITAIQLLERVRIQKYIELGTDIQKNDFAKEVRTMFPDQFLLERVDLETKKIGVLPEMHEYSFRLQDNIDLRKFWELTEFREMLAFAYITEVVSADITLWGWSVRTRQVSDVDYRQQFGDTFSFSTGLIPGSNTVYLRALTRDAAVAVYDSVSFFYKTTVKSNIVPAEFSAQPFHTETNEQQCASCHDFELSAAAREPTGTVQAECSPCHGILVSRKSAHGPAASWLCLICHDPDSTPKYQLFAGKSYESPLCFECHADMKEKYMTKPVIHAPVANQGCRWCHDPHGSTEPTMVIARVVELCPSCHTTIMEISHPVVGHPYSGRPNPRDPTKELSCASCHNPHGSENKFLLFAPGFSVCQECHNK